MSNLHALPKGARAIAFELKQLCEDAGAGYHFIHGGKHPKIVVTYKGNTKRMSFASSASDHRAMKNCVAQLRRLLVSLGWYPNAKAKEETGVKKMPVADIYKNQKTSTGAASKVTTIDPKIIVVGEQTFSVPAKSKATWEERNAVLLEAFEAGASNEAMAAAANAAGWKIKPVSVSALLVRARNVREGKHPEAPRRNRNKPTMKEVQFKNVAKPKPKAVNSDDLALEIAQAIAPVLDKHLHNLKAKAEKYETLKALLDD